MTKKWKYIRIRIDGKTVLEHRHIMSEAINRKLKKNEIVHHKDGDPTNNDIDNLIIMTRNEHATHHGKKEGSITTCICDYCDQEYNISSANYRWKKRNNEKFFCSRPCIGYYNFQAKKKVLTL